MNGVWLMELYLGNTLALNKQIEDRYTNLHVNHFSFDNQFTLEYMDAWKALIRLPIEKIKVTKKKININIIKEMKNY